MSSASPAAIRKQILSGATDPVYLLQGEDEIEKSGLAHEFEELVDEGLRAFNVERIHTGDATTGDRLTAAVGNVIAAARTLPMMAPRRVVIVLQADALFAPKRESEAATRALGELEEFLKAPEPQTTLVFVAGALDRRSRIYKLLLKHATIVECGVLADLGDAERWVRNRVAASGMEIEQAGARLLAERCGTDVKRLRNDVVRLLLYALGRSALPSPTCAKSSGRRRCRTTGR
jgi:DNA polymerase-3 subunit delta